MSEDIRQRLAKEWVECTCRQCRYAVWLCIRDWQEYNDCDHQERLLAAHQETCDQHRYEGHQV